MTNQMRMPKTHVRVLFAMVVTLATGGWTKITSGQDLSNPPAALSDDRSSQANSQAEADQFVHPAEVVKAAFGAPPEASKIGNRNVWIDSKRKRVYVDGYVTMREGPLEMLACPVGTKEHESVIATLASSREVHAALLAVGAKPGTPVAFLPRFVPATGQRIRVWVCYRNASGEFKSVDARRWIRKGITREHLVEDWVFGGSGFWKDPRDNREYYRADGGDMICVSNFTTAMMDVPIASSAEAAQLLYQPFTDRIPEQGTPVRMVLLPIPLPSDKPRTKPQADPDEAPTEKVLPAAEKK